MKRKVKKKLTLHRETILALADVVGAKTGVSTPLSACVPTACGTICLDCLPADSTPDNGCMTSLEVPCEPVSRYC